MKLRTILLLIACIVIGLIWYNHKNQSLHVPPINTTDETDTLPLTLKSVEVQTSDSSFSLSIPNGFQIAIAAENLGRARFMAKSPDDKLFVTNMKNLSDNELGEIYILSDFDSTTKKFTNKTTYLANLRNPNSLTFHTDTNGTHWLYIALTDKLLRYKYTLNETSPTSEPEILATFPDYGLNYKYGGWHLTRTVRIHNDKVYVSVGSSCNSCEEKENVRAAIVEMDLDGSNQHIIATGLRNAVGLAIKGNALFASNMGSDHLGPERPEETLYEITSGTNYGWPYCYEYQNQIFSDTTTKWNTSIDCTTVPLAHATFPAHTAPLGLTYFDLNSPKELQDSFLLALHGSGDVSLKKGYSIVQIDSKGNVSDFITGFLQDTNRYGRPVDIMQDGDKGLFFTDDYAGILYYLHKE